MRAKRDHIGVFWGVRYIRKFIGSPYYWAGSNPMQGFDCSGLVVEMLKATGYLGEFDDLTAAQLFDRYTKVEKPKRGVLAYFGLGRNIHHVGICINHRLMIEAGGGRKGLTSFADATKLNAYVRIRPIRKNTLQGFNDPFLR